MIKNLWCSFFLFLLLLTFWIGLVHSINNEPAQYTLNKLVGYIPSYSVDGVPKLQAGFTNIMDITVASDSGQVFLSDQGNGVKQYSLDNASSVISPVSGLQTANVEILVSNRNGSELYYFENKLIKRWKDGVITVIAGNGFSDNQYHENETLATQTFLNNPSKLQYETDCLYLIGYGIAKLNLTSGMISTIFKTGIISDMFISKQDGFLYFTQGLYFKKCLLTSRNCDNPTVFLSSSQNFDSLVFSPDRNEFYLRMIYSGVYICSFNLKTSFFQNIYFNSVYGIGGSKMFIRNDKLYFVDFVKIKKINLQDTSTAVDEAGIGFYPKVNENAASKQTSLSIVNVPGIALRNEELYYSDLNVIKKIDKNGIVRKVAGTGSFTTLASFNETAVALKTEIKPTVLSFSKQGELYFVDNANYVRKVSDNGNMTHILGNRNIFAVTDGIEASKAIITPKSILESGDELIICELQRIRKVSSQGIISTIAGGGTNQFQEGALATKITIPAIQSCAINPVDSSLYFSSYNFIRKVASNSSVTTLLSDTNTKYVIGVDGNGFVYYYYYFSGKIFIGKVNPETKQNNADYFNTTTTSQTIFATVSNSGDVYYALDCRIYLVLRNGTQKIYVGSSSCSTISFFDGMNSNQPIQPNNIRTIYYSNSDNLLYISAGNGVWKVSDGIIYKVIIQTIQSYTISSIDISKYFNLISSLIVKQNGDMIFVDAPMIRKYNAQQDRIENLYIGDGSYGPASNVLPISIPTITHCENDLILASSNGIRRFNGDTSIMTPIAFYLDTQQVSCVNNNLYFASQPLYSIKKLSLSDVNLENIAGVSLKNGQSPDGTIAKSSSIITSSSYKAFTLPNQEVLYFEGTMLRKIGLDGKWQTIVGNGVCGSTPDFAVNAKNVSFCNNVNSVAYSELTGTIYFSSNGIYSLTPYCREGYQFENSFKTSCVKEIIPITCYGKVANDSSVCSSRGVCVGIDNCQCSNLYISSDCSVSLCQTESGKQNTILCPQTNTPTTGNTVTQPTLNVTESKTEIVKDLTQIDSKNITFTSTNSIQITLPSTISTFVSNQISKNETIQIISAISEKTQIIKPQTSNSGNEQTNEISIIEVVSKVVSLILLKQDGQKIQVSNLINPITFTFANLIIKSTETLNLTCSYLDEITKEWKSDGLTTNINQITNSGNEKQVTINCETNHLTSFAVIDMNLKKGNTLRDNAPITTDNTVLIAAVVSSVVGVFILVSVISIIIIVSICLIRKRKNSKSNE